MGGFGTRHIGKISRNNKKKKNPEEEKNLNSLTSKEEETNGHQTSQAKQV